MIFENHIITCDLTEFAETIQADPNLLEQAFNNLMSNASKYAPESPSIDVKASQANGHVLLSVRDYGVGIVADELD